MRGRQVDYEPLQAMLDAHHARQRERKATGREQLDVDPATARWVERSPERQAFEDRLDAATDDEHFALLEEVHHWDEPAEHLTADDGETGAAPAPLGTFDLEAYRSTPLPPRSWLELGIFEFGAVNKLTAASGVGKSILLAHCAISWSLGRSALDAGADGKPRKLDRPMRVLYVDGELGPAWWHRMTEDKLKVPRSLPEFMLYTLDDNPLRPTWPALSTPEGAKAFLSFIEACGELDIIIMDTLSAFVGGEENSNDTWAEFDRLVTLPLKAAGFTIVYADHAGHNGDRARGGSAKKAKLDVEAFLDAPDETRPNERVLTNDAKRGKMRNGFDGHPQVVQLTRVDNPLGHVRTGAIDRPQGNQSAADRAALMQVFRDSEDGLTRTQACNLANGARKRLEAEFDAMVSTGRLIPQKTTTTNARGEKRTRTVYVVNQNRTLKLSASSTEHSRSPEEVDP